MPAETDRHERTLMCWPTAERPRRSGTTSSTPRGRCTPRSRRDRGHEPVTMVAAPSDADGACATCGPDVEVRALPIDDASMRDSGPIIVRAPDATRHAVHFRFNAWGEKYAPYDQDAAIGARVAAALGLPVYDAPLVLEGGSIAVDGAGILVTTERCLLNENRNPGMSKAEIEAALRHWLGVDRIVWLATGSPRTPKRTGTSTTSWPSSDRLACCCRVAPILTTPTMPTQPTTRRAARGRSRGRRDRRRCRTPRCPVWRARCRT